MTEQPKIDETKTMSAEEIVAAAWDELVRTGDWSVLNKVDEQIRSTGAKWSWQAL